MINVCFSNNLSGSILNQHDHGIKCLYDSRSLLVDIFLGCCCSFHCCTTYSWGGREIEIENRNRDRDRAKFSPIHDLLRSHVNRVCIPTIAAISTCVLGMICACSCSCCSLQREKENSCHRPEFIIRCGI